MNVAKLTLPFEKEKVQQWGQVVLLALLFTAVLMLMAKHAYASDGTEFEAATSKFEGWVKGNLGKLAALIALAIGSLIAAAKKDWSWFAGAVILSMGIGIIVGIINASFTAVI